MAPNTSLISRQLFLGLRSMEQLQQQGGHTNTHLPPVYVPSTGRLQAHIQGLHLNGICLCSSLFNPFLVLGDSSAGKGGEAHGLSLTCCFFFIFF